jgi:hypothetical protein
MFNLNENQRKILLATAVSAGAFWLANQIADSTIMERVWGQLAILTLCLGAMRVWVLEAAKPRKT